MRAIYLTYLNNSDKNICQVQFFDEEVEIVFANNSVRRFLFQAVGSSAITSEDINKKLDATLKVGDLGQDLEERSDCLKVKYEELRMYSKKIYFYLFLFIYLFIFKI